MTELVQIGDQSGQNRDERPRSRRPEWLRIRIATPERYREVKGWWTG